MFGMVVATGLKVLAESHASRGDGRNNLFIVAVSVVVGMIPMLNAKIFSACPPWLSPFTHSGIVLAALTALLLNLYLNGYRIQRAQEAASQC